MSAIHANEMKTSEALGADTLLQLLKNYTRNRNIKTACTIGIIGYPNVGKSSLINSLKRSRAVTVGATPGDHIAQRDEKLSHFLSENSRV